MPTFAKRLTGLALILLIAYGLFVAAMHGAYAVHENRSAVGQRDTQVLVQNSSKEQEAVPGEKKSSARYLPVLMYHHIDDEPEKFQSGTITPERFEEDMLILTALGFETVDTEDLALFLHGKKPLPERPIMVTIDDGYASVYEYAYPILKSVRQKAVSTVIGSSVGRSTHLFKGTPIIPHYSWEEARKMSESGAIDIQSHSFDLHRPGEAGSEPKGAGKKSGETNAAYIERFTADTLNNHHFIEENVSGHRVALYSYPYGIHNDITENTLKELGYLATLTIEPGINEIEQGFFALKRINMAEYASGYVAFEELLTMMNMREPIPYTEHLSRKERNDALREMIGLSKRPETSAPDQRNRFKSPRE